MSTTLIIQKQLCSVCRLDGWLSAAADCLELFPDQLIVFAGEQLSHQGGDSLSGDQCGVQAASQKRLLFETISKFYSGQERAPLLSGHHLDIHVAILNLLGRTGYRYFAIHDCGILKIVGKDLMDQYFCYLVEIFHFLYHIFVPDEGKVQDAIKASQLCLRLLETSVRDELRRLLTFMATAAHPDACRLQKQVIHLYLSFFFAQLHYTVIHTCFVFDVLVCFVSD